MIDVYPRIETGNAAPANPPRLLDVVREKRVASSQYVAQRNTGILWLQSSRIPRCSIQVTLAG